MRRITIVQLILIGILLAGSHPGWASQQEKSKHTIVPRVGVGDLTHGMGDKIVSRVLPYPDFVSLFVRLPIAHCAATGKGVGIAVVDLSQDVHIETIIKQTAPDAVVKTYVWDSERNDRDGLLRSLAGDACRVVVLPDGHHWPASQIQDLVQQLIEDSILVVLPSDLSEEKDRIQTVNTLQNLGVLTVGRVDRQSMVMEGSREGHKPFNAHIRDIHTDVFSTVGIRPNEHTPVATVSGIAALVWQKWPGLSAKEVKERIVSGARPVWQSTSIETGKWRGDISVDPVTTEYTPRDEKTVFRFRTADAPGALGVDTEIPWFLNMLNCHKAWEITRGQGMVIAISDQGFHLKHPALKDKIKTQQSFGPRSFTSPGQNFHGTDMSRILLSVAPEAQIVPLLCSSKSFETLPQVIAKSFEYALDNKVDVISASWSGRMNNHPELLAAIREAVDGGTVVSWFHYPESYPGLLRSSFTYAGWHENARIGFSDRFLTDPPGFHPVEIEAGLSGTAPQAAGIAALAKTVNPKLNPRQIERLIYENSTPIGNGALIPDAYAIVRAAIQADVHDGAAGRRAPSKNIIVPGVGVGDYTFDMSKDEVLKKLGEPEVIQLDEDEFVRRGQEKYNLNNLPRKYIMSFGNISFFIDDDSVGGIMVRSPLYKLSNGLKVGDSEQKIKQAFGEDFQLEEDEGKEYLLSDAKRLAFEIHKKNRTVTEIIIFQPEGDRGDRDAPDQQEQSKGTIVPGVGMGDYTFDMSKDDVLKKLGEPRNIHYGGEDYTLDNLPKRYFMFYHGISFYIVEEAVTGIATHRPRYKFANGLKVGDSEDKLKQAFGSDFKLEEFERMDAIIYEEKGLRFEIDKNSRTIEEIGINQVKRDQRNMNIPKVRRRDDLGPYEDVSGKDLRAFDLRYSEDILDTLEFNQETLWPPSESLPEGFDPQVLLQEGMNPGLGVRNLHAQGITGAGVHVGLIDQPLLLDHPEYAGKIVSYHAIDCGPNKSSMHGPAMASQLVGKRCGTAPGASLHVVAVPSWKADAAYYARALDRFVTYNENAPKEQKIRVVSVSCQPSGEGSIFKNQPLWDEAVQRAQAQDILVLDCTWHHGFVSLCWLDPENRESVEACTPGFRLGEVEVDEGHIHVPSAPRTAAEADEDRPFGYAYDGGGRRSRRPKAKNGYSDTIPFAAGILALGWQVRPDLTPAQMKELLFASAYVHESGAKIIHPTAFIDLIQNQSSQPVSEGVCKADSETQTIVPGVRVGDYTLGMSKDDVLSKLGEPETIQFGEDEVIRRGQKKYNLNDLPKEYILSFSDVSFWFENDSVQVISVHSPLYKLSNGSGMGDSEQKIKQAFGEDFQLEEAMGKELRCYHAKGIGFEIHKKNRTVAEIIVYRTEGGGGDPNVPDSAEAALVRKAAAEGRIAYKLTTPEEFKAIAGMPIREWKESDGQLIYLKYPGIQVRFFGKPEIETPHTLVSISCEGRGIDIGQNRPIVLRNEGDLHKLGSFWGFSNIDLSRLDLSQKGDLLNQTTFDSLTVWPLSDRLPPGFDPAKRLEWGKNPGLGVRSLHREGITGKGVGIAIIDQPLLKDHIEYANRIKSYHAIEVKGVDIQMHGPPVCSIAVGKTCGVAPEANLRYYAVPPWKWLENRPWARTVEQIVERNRDLPPSEKVRVISISLGAFSRRDYYDQWRSAVEKAHQNGILVVSCDDRDFMPYVTLERLVGTNPDDPNNYYFDSGVDALYVPASNWSIASHRGKDVYTFDTHGGNSWTVPYLAGLAALAFQVHPEISPDRIVALFQETATRTKRGRVINPRGFIEAVKRIKNESL